jgi:hypothetical protein
MKSYRDYLNDKGVPEGPWIVDEKGQPLNKPKVVQLRKAVDKSRRV